MKDIISKQTRIGFREYFVDVVIREIRDSFDMFDARCDYDHRPDCSGDRRQLVERYYHTVDWSNQNEVSKILKVFENVIKKLQQPLGAGYFIEEQENKRLKTLEKLINFLNSDGFEYKNGKLNSLHGFAMSNALTDIAKKLDGEQINLQVKRMKASIDSDPSLTIGTAKELVETVCKTILEERGVVIEKKNPEISDLTKVLLKELSLVPEMVDSQKTGHDAIKNILRSLGTIGNDLGTLRNKFGTGHGDVAKAKGLLPRHAKLAAGTAATLVTFLYETHREKLNKETLNV